MWFERDSAAIRGVDIIDSMPNHKTMTSPPGIVLQPRPSRIWIASVNGAYIRLLITDFLKKKNIRFSKFFENLTQIEDIFLLLIKIGPGHLKTL